MVLLLKICFSSFAPSLSTQNVNKFFPTALLSISRSVNSQLKIRNDIIFIIITNTA